MERKRGGMMGIDRLKHWVSQIFPIHRILARLALGLIAVAVYCVFVLWIVSVWRIPGLHWGLEAGMLNSIVLGLLLGFRNRNAYDRWWEGRRLWGQLVNNCRNFGCKLNAFVPAERLVESQMFTLLGAFPTALSRRLRSEPVTLEELGVATFGGPHPEHVPLYLTERMYQVLAAWKRSGEVGDGVLRVMDMNLNALMDVCGACERIRNTEIAVSYKGMLRIGIALNLIAVPWFACQHLGVMSIPVILMMCFFMLGVELIDTDIEEPFGHDSDDLDLDRYCATIRASLEELEAMRSLPTKAAVEHR